MNIATLPKIAEKLITDNAPAILTGVGVVGTLVTAYLTGKASFEAADEIWHNDFQRGTLNDPPLLTSEKFKMAWPKFLPAAGVAATTVTCIIFANRINSKRAAALAVAYSLSEKRFSEYKEKITEKLGVKEEAQVRADITNDEIRRGPQTVIVAEGDVTIFDVQSGRYFKSTMANVREAAIEINEEVVRMGSAIKLDDFYDKIGLDATGYSSEVGWTVDCMLIPVFSPMMGIDDKPCLKLEYDVTDARFRHLQ